MEVLSPPPTSHHTVHAGPCSVSLLFILSRLCSRFGSVKACPHPPPLASWFTRTTLAKHTGRKVVFNNPLACLCVVASPRNRNYILKLYPRLPVFLFPWLGLPLLPRVGKPPDSSKSWQETRPVPLGASGDAVLWNTLEESVAPPTPFRLKQPSLPLDDWTTRLFLLQFNSFGVHSNIWRRR